MLINLLIWLYLGVISFVVGFGAIRFLDRTHSYECAHPGSYLLAGIATLTVYSELFSIFYKVGLLANLVMCIVTLLIAILLRKPICAYLTKLTGTISISLWIIGIVLTCIFAYGSAHGYMHYDSDLYHAQSIRWIEEYGLVPGLGNLHSRFAYNSASFCLSALFSFSFLGYQSYHACAGFLALVVASFCIELFRKRAYAAPTLADIARIVAVYYILNIFDEMVSPASDYFVVLMILAAFILYLEVVLKYAGSESDRIDETEIIYPMVLLSLLGLVIVSIKVSGAFIVLLAVLPAILLIKSKATRDIIRYIIAGIVVVIPFLVRNVILSGYLVYPMAGIDIFNFDFKMSPEMVTYDAREVQTYGRCIAVEDYAKPISFWIGGWFKSLDKINKVCFIFAILALFVVLGSLIYVLVRKRYKELATLSVVLVCGICFLYLMATSPNIRFACVFIWMLPAIGIGYLYLKVTSSFDKYKLFRLFIIVFIFYKSLMFSYELGSGFNPEYIVKVQDYGQYEVSPISIDGIEFYVPTQGDQVGYAPFPSSPYANFELRGDELKSGFKYKK